VKAAPVRAGAAFVLADPVLTSAVVAHDGGVRLICAGGYRVTMIQMNGTAVYERASLPIVVRITLWLIVLCRLVHAPRQRRSTRFR
jgi:hypothetical protein